MQWDGEMLSLPMYRRDEEGGREGVGRDGVVKGSLSHADRSGGNGNVTKNSHQQHPPGMSSRRGAAASRDSGQRLAPAAVDSVQKWLSAVASRGQAAALGFL